MDDCKALYRTPLFNAAPTAPLLQGWRGLRRLAWPSALALSLFCGLLAMPAGGYPLAPASLCGSTDTCQQVLDAWNAASRADLVDDAFNTGPLPLAAVRWYTTEGQCTGSPLCDDQLHNGDGSCLVLDSATSFFCGVTDELSNVLVSHAMGSSQADYEKLHNFTELLRHPAINGLQCWKYYVDGVHLYDGYEDLCEVSDSASDASLRILLAYSIACAKQEVGIWTAGAVDYCADYLEPGRQFAREERAALASRFPRDPTGVLREVARARVRRMVESGWPLTDPTVRFWNSLFGRAVG